MIRFARLARTSGEADMDYLVRSVTFIRERVGLGLKDITIQNPEPGLMYVWWEDGTGDMPGLPDDDPDPKENDNPDPDFPFPIPLGSESGVLESEMSGMKKEKLE